MAAGVAAVLAGAAPVPANPKPIPFKHANANRLTPPSCQPAHTPPSLADIAGGLQRLCSLSAAAPLVTDVEVATPYIDARSAQVWFSEEKIRMYRYADTPANGEAVAVAWLAASTLGAATLGAPNKPPVGFGSSCVTPSQARSPEVQSTRGYALALSMTQANRDLRASGASASTCLAC